MGCDYCKNGDEKETELDISKNQSEKDRDNFFIKPLRSNSKGEITKENENEVNNEKAEKNEKNEKDEKDDNNNKSEMNYDKFQGDPNLSQEIQKEFNFPDNSIKISRKETLKTINKKTIFCEDKEYNERVFNLINQIRENPSEYVEEIEYNKDFIQNEVKKYINRETGIEQEERKIVFKRKIKVKLHKGKEQFDNAIHHLEGIYPMKKLEYSREISIPFPDNENEYTKEYLTNIVNEKKKK